MRNRKILALAVSIACAPTAVLATNGMNLEGYGPIATAMGGASMAYDNGTAAMMNNVATLGLMDEGSRADVALGSLSPSISDSVMGSSSAGPFLMPAIGWAKHEGAMTYGVGMMGQGGMGTEYVFGGQTQRSEVGVLRVLVPFVYNVSSELKVGVSLDYVRAGMDLQMTAPGAQLGSMVTGGTMAPGVPGVMTATTMGRFDFSDSSDYTGAASGSGFAGNLGIVYQASPELSVGASYHAKTSMSDLEGGTTMTFYNISMAGNGVVDTPEFAMKGNISVKDFQWPSTLGLGVNYQVSDALSIAADFKKINWSEVMKDFKMTFTADTNVNYGGFSGGTLDVTMPQNWDDQTVISIGGAYAMNDQLTLRAGYNSSSNPVPDMYMNPLFPATIEKHITFGLGYGLSDKSSIDFSMTSAPEVSATNGSGQTVKHSQTNWQFMYSVKY